MAAADFFLNIDGIKGESPDAKHADEIQVLSWSWGESQSGAHAGGGGGGAGKVQMQDFHFTMHTNKASPVLFLNCANGAHIKKAQLTCRKAGGTQQEYLKIHFEDLLISSYQIGGASGADTLPMDQIAFNFTKIKMEYAQQKADGSLGSAVIHGWDVKKNVKL
jgi:type VI secretion system secreted protein Hcp